MKFLYVLAFISMLWIPTALAGQQYTDTQRLLRHSVQEFIKDPGNENLAEIIHALTEDVLDEYYDDGSGDGLIDTIKNLLSDDETNTIILSPLPDEEPFDGNNQIQQSVEGLDKLRDIEEN